MRILATQGGMQRGYETESLTSYEANCRSAVIKKKPRGLGLSDQHAVEGVAVVKRQRA
jgi:hypothetical protein